MSDMPSPQARKLGMCWPIYARRSGSQEAMGWMDMHAWTANKCFRGRNGTILDRPLDRLDRGDQEKVKRGGYRRHDPEPLSASIASGRV
jgi:hypothetical protein